MPTDVVRLADLDRARLARMLRRYHLELVLVATGEPVPGSFWGDDEAGLRGDRLYARADTPLHSILHEAAHYICMDEIRRRGLDTDAGSDDDEESAVCFLQVLLADRVADYDRARLFADMDAWGYSFRLGSARAWFENDAEDAHNWLKINGLIDDQCQPLAILRR